MRKRILATKLDVLEFVMKRGLVCAYEPAEVNGKEALGKIKGGKYSLVSTGICMPYMNIVIFEVASDKENAQGKGLRSRCRH